MHSDIDMVSVTIEAPLKQGAETVFERLGLSAGEAINLFYEQVWLRQTLPFEWRPFNQATQEAMEDARLRRNLITADCVEDIFRNLDDDDDK